ncbi:hypothetical protein HIM_03031 [Hirsutella minnesotensis 3608]|nr:hypothetical protein HIM_03031 [Hirsutella minnesotensis 3608]
MNLGELLGDQYDKSKAAPEPSVFRRPRLRAFDPKAALATLQQYRENPIGEASYIDPETQKRRDRLWRNWEECFRRFRQDSLRESMDRSMSWLEGHEADKRVMRPKRLAEPDRAAFWSLKFSSRHVGQGCGPAYEIGRWIPFLADELGLSKQQGFEKSEITSEDVICILDTLWRRAEDIPCKPSTRLAFHCATVLGGIGGWRPGSLVRIKYQDVSIAWIRDPKVPSKTWPLVYTTIHHVKQRRHRIERDQRSRLRFPMSIVPHKLVCLLTLFTARAIADNAFEAGFDRCDQVLYPPPLEDGVDFVPLKWKASILDEQIVPIAYSSFREIWNRVHLVAGSRDTKRPYSLRVGAGGRLDGSLTPALRNFILSHSTDVFERSYQPVQIRERLAEIAYGESAKQDDDLWSVISNAFLQRDPFAPLYLTQGEVDEFGHRRDVQNLRERYKAAQVEKGVQCREAKEIHARLTYIYKCLEALKLEEKRRAYFAEVDRLRASGQPTTHLHDPSATNPRRKVHKTSSSVAAKISLLFTDKNPPKGLPGKLVAYVKNWSHEEDDEGGQEEEGLGREAPDSTTEREQPRCLFGCGAYYNRRVLTKHVRAMHMDVFEQPFLCPECERLGWGECVIEASPSAWSSHVQRKHGKRHTPDLRPGIWKPACCMLCQEFFTRRGFTSHFNSRHPESEFAKDFTCSVCLRHGRTESISITSRDAWIAHVAEAHQGGEIRGAVLVKDEEDIVRRGLLEAKMRFKEGTNLKDLSHCRSSGSTGPERQRKRRLNKYLGQESEELEAVEWAWKDEAADDTHAEEEYWVTGRDSDDAAVCHGA